MFARTLVFVVFVGYALAQESNYCITPLGDNGECINIKRCDGLVRLLRSQIQNPEVQNYLRRSTCGYVGTTPLVCCPTIRSQFESTTTTTTTTTTERPLFTVPPQIIPTFTPPTTPSTAPVETRQPSLEDRLRPPYCGFSNDSNTRVVGGMPANLGEYPWMVALGYRGKTDQPRWQCGGTLITDRHVLTAAHCIHGKNVYTVRVGDLDLYSDDDGATPINIPIAAKKIHEEYSPTVFVNDIAILTLEYPVRLASVWPVCLPIDPPHRNNIFENYQAFVSGWGAVYFNGPSSPRLQKVILPVVPTDRCKQAFAKANTIIDERIICAGYTEGGMDSCQGDSGGPLMYGHVQNRKKHFYQIGVVSYGYRCAEKGYPGVYTRVTQFIDWILKQIE